jgi:CDP-paratose 2-epimerase
MKILITGICGFAGSTLARSSARSLGDGDDTEFSTEAPISLYGSTKLSCEALALGYGLAFGFPVWINRCGVLAGAGQFGTPDQGIFSYWINAHLRRLPMRYIGFGGTGHQVRDAISSERFGRVGARADFDIAQGRKATLHVGGGSANAMSLAQLTAWCDSRFGKYQYQPQADDRPRKYDVPWLVMDSTLAAEDFGWTRTTKLAGILDEIACHAEQHPDWLEVSGL